MLGLFPYIVVHLQLLLSEADQYLISSDLHLLRVSGKLEGLKLCFESNCAACAL